MRESAPEPEQRAQTRRAHRSGRWKLSPLAPRERPDLISASEAVRVRQPKATPQCAGLQRESEIPNGVPPRSGFVPSLPERFLWMCFVPIPLRGSPAQVPGLLRFRFAVPHVDLLQAERKLSAPARGQVLVPRTGAPDRTTPELAAGRPAVPPPRFPAFALPADPEIPPSAHHLQIQLPARAAHRENVGFAPSIRGRQYVNFNQQPLG